MPYPNFKIRMLLHDMETELGIAHLKHIERDVLYAIENLSENTQDIAAKDILEHNLIKSVSRPTIYRALKTLQNENLIQRDPSCKSNFSNLKLTI